MKIDSTNTLNNILSSLKRTDHIDPETIPNMSMYMDQLTSFIESELSKTKRYPDDKIMTKTMVNNYVKNGLIPPPDKKRYSKDHILLLTFIYYFKNFMSMNDIEKLLVPIEEAYFDNSSASGISLTDIYNKMFSLQEDQIEAITKDIEEKYTAAMNAFPECSGSESEQLKYFSFVCSLCFDIYMRKTILEKLIDIK